MSASTAITFWGLMILSGISNLHVRVAALQGKEDRYNQVFGLVLFVMALVTLATSFIH